MNIKTVYSSRPLCFSTEEDAKKLNEQFIKKPFPMTDGWWLMLNKGDLYSPDSWADTKRCYRTFVRWIPRPFLAYRKGSFGFYVGWKIWGCDTDPQLKQIGINPKEVFPGSIAMQGCTIRFSENVK